MRSTLLCLLLLALHSGIDAGAAEPRGKFPNVVLIMTDDQGYGDVGSHGNQWIETPVHDRIAAEGIRFDRFFVSPVCAPTRASLLTGRWHLRTGVHGVTRGHETMRSSEVTMAELFRKAGYATAAFGKWHNGAHLPEHPNGQGFDEFYGFCAGHWNNYFDTGLEHNGSPVRGRGFIIDDLTDHAIQFIREHRDRPFFCYLPYNTPHTPWQVPDRFWMKYRDRTELTLEARCAYAMCENIDENMGRLLATLSELSLEQDTIVVFLTDNGANTDRFNAGMRGRKGSLHEGGTRVPLFVRWKDHLPAGQLVKPIAAHIDLLPTLAELAGIEIPSQLDLDGRSLVPLMRGQADAWPDRTLFAHWGDGPDGTPNRQRGAVRTDRWRAVQERPGQWQLFDMQADPGQKQDLASQHPEVTEDLAAQFEQWITDVCADGFETIPIQVGVAGRDRVVLHGHEAFLWTDSGPVLRGQEQAAGISYHGRAGWANDWVTNWTSLAAWPQWNVSIQTPGRYAVQLHYVCAPDNAGARVRVELLGQTATGTIQVAHDPPPLPSPDRIPRKEVYEKLWATLDLGTMELPARDGVLRVRALSRPGQSVMDLKDVVLTRLAE